MRFARLIARLAAAAAISMLFASTARAGEPDRYVIDYDDSHPAPRLSAVCGFPITVREYGTLIDALHFDRSGNFAFETLTFQRAGVAATNANTGRTLTSIQTGLIVYTDDRATSSGITANFHLPGGGMVLIDAGRFIVDFASGARVFEAGTHDYIDGNLQAFCAALAP